jgi:Flp pilus assembly protein protease CpaA
MMIELILDVIFLCILAVCTITDLKKRIIPNSAVACLFLLGLFQIAVLLVSGESVLPNLLAFAVSLPGLQAWRCGKIGGGDIKLLMGMGLYLGIWRMAILCIGMALTCLIFLLWQLTQKYKPERVPFAPFLFIGGFFTVVMTYF